MDKTTQERIKADAEAYANRPYYKSGILKNGYIAGATAEAEKAQKLVDALEKIRTWQEQNARSAAWSLTHIKNFALNTLQQWKEGKEVSGKDANEIGRVFINKILLLAAGFEELNKDDYDFFVKDKVEVWDFNGEYWIVDMLDQAGIEKQFQYMDELETLFHSFGLSFYNQQEQQ